MAIDWFTFTAQIINFLILIWLLQRFLYGPVIRAMSEREDTIAQRFADADAAQERADAACRDYEEKHQELAQTRESLLARAGQDVNAWREEQMRQARADVEEDRREWHAELNRDKQTLLRELQLDVTQHAVELGRHVLREMADQSLQSRLVDRFISRLDGADLSSLKSVDGAGRSLIVESSHALNEDEQSRIMAALSQTQGAVRFETNPKLICGIGLQTPGFRFAWNVQESVAELESDLIDAVEATLPGGAEASFTRGASQSSEARES